MFSVSTRTVSIVASVLLLSALIVDVSAAKPQSFHIPTNAKKIAEDVYSLGTAKDKDGTSVEGFMFIHRKENAATKGERNGARATKCYSFLAADAKWKTAESWLINTANTRGLTDTFLLANTAGNVAKWEVASGVDFMGLGSSTTDILSAETVSPDGNNEVYFGTIADAGVIAVTTTWGTFSGPAKNRKLVEFDQVFDQTDFDWSSTGQAGKMDYENISTHELGHAFGMGHPPSTCSDETMYAYADNGETKKRDLNAGDIAGIQELY